MIHKLSDHALTEDEFLVLTKALSFVPRPTKAFKQEINKINPEISSRFAC